MKPRKLGHLIAAPERPALLRGELWVSPEVVSRGGFDPGPKGLVDLASSLGADVTFFHWPESAMACDLKEVLGFAHAAGLDCGLTLDGPFQRLTLTRNLLDLLQELGRDPARFQDLLVQEMDEITEALDLIMESGTELVVIGEDLGYTGGLYFSPEVFRKILVPLYRRLLTRLSSSGMVLGWHSDGDVAPLLPDLVECGFRFFSLEPECVDLLKFKQAYGSRITLIGGVRAAWLSGKEMDENLQRACLEKIGALAREGGLILSSSCGVYSPEFLPILRRLYHLVEAAPFPPAHQPDALS